MIYICMYNVARPAEECLPALIYRNQAAALGRYKPGHLTPILQLLKGSNESVDFPKYSDLRR